MPRPVVTAIRFRPPFVIARLGDSDSPLESFTWAQDTRLFSAQQTLIRPAVSLEVLPDGSVEPYLPGPIRFRDGVRIRPVCPFLELQADIERDPTKEEREARLTSMGNARTFRVYETLPLTAELLQRAGLDLSQIVFNVVAANRKAQRRTGDPTCSYEARLAVRADDHGYRDLFAWTHELGPNPLIRQEQAIWLGAFQVIRPTRRKDKYDVRLDTLRVRFTPGRGAVYGPASAVTGQARNSRGRHIIVPAENRIVNPAANWCTLNSVNPPYPQPIPANTYDGENDLDLNPVSSASWGVVDDTCDAMIVATLGGLRATARVLVGPPDFAPDRRPLVSFADDLADRDPEQLRPSPRFEDAPDEWLETIIDLFRRVSETASMMNVERARAANLPINQALGPNRSPLTNSPSFPDTGSDSMTLRDRIDGGPMMSVRFDALAAGDAGDAVNGAPLLPKSELGRSRHGELAVPEVLLDFLQRNSARLQTVARPPFRRMNDPKGNVPPTPLDLRDPQNPRSYAFDARMPPYLRDCDCAPLSLTRHQWNLLFEQQEDGSFLPRHRLFELAAASLRKYR